MQKRICADDGIMTGMDNDMSEQLKQEQLEKRVESPNSWRSWGQNCPSSDNRVRYQMQNKQKNIYADDSIGRTVETVMGVIMLSEY